MNGDGIIENDDTDKDGVPNFQDPDDDGDGIPTIIEVGDLSGEHPRNAQDSDNDGVPDYLDPDDDGDGTPTRVEGMMDHNGNGVPDHLDGAAQVALYMPLSANTQLTPTPKPTSTPTEPAPSPVLQAQIRIAQSQDDAEEHHDGIMDLSSSDLEMVEEADLQTVGLRFQNVNIPPGATILQANLIFESHESSSKEAHLIFHGESSDNAEEFSTSKRDISERPTTASSVAWLNVPDWSYPHEIHLSPSLVPIVQEIVNRRGWQSGNAMVFIVTGEGTRSAKSYDGDMDSAPMLQITYQ